MDKEYFSRLRTLGNLHGHQKIYNDFVSVYTPTNKDVDTNVLNLITKIADGYGPDAEEIDIWFSVIYAGMIAEENKARAILKKRVKRLGMHQVMIEGMAAEHAAKFSIGKKWRDLDAIMKQKGF